VSSHSVPRIFVVDDEHVIAATLATILNMHGFSARFFTDPVEALAAARLEGGQRQRTLCKFRQAKGQPSIRRYS
jgi:CheY-like chemotaxis protein